MSHPIYPTPHLPSVPTDWRRYETRHLPDERGGMQCLQHVLAGWPMGEDCPCAAAERGDY